MRSIFTYLVSLLLLPGCETLSQGPDYQTSQGVEIYLAKHVNSYNPQLDYTQIDLDTVLLEEKPVISYKDIKKYHLQNHIVELNIEASKIKGYEPKVYGHMFVVTVDKERIYCGFFRPLLSSAIFDWVIIDETFDTRSKNLPIHFINNAPEKDPRSDNRITERLKKDGKLK